MYYSSAPTSERARQENAWINVSHYQQGGHPLRPPPGISPVPHPSLLQGRVGLPYPQTHPTSFCYPDSFPFSPVRPLNSAVLRYPPPTLQYSASTYDSRTGYPAPHSLPRSYSTSGTERNVQGHPTTTSGSFVPRTHHVQGSRDRHVVSNPRPPLGERSLQAAVSGAIIDSARRDGGIESVPTSRIRSIETARGPQLATEKSCPPMAMYHHSGAVQPQASNARQVQPLSSASPSEQLSAVQGNPSQPPSLLKISPPFDHLGDTANSEMDDDEAIASEFGEVADGESSQEEEEGVKIEGDEEGSGDDSEEEEGLWEDAESEVGYMSDRDDVVEVRGEISRAEGDNPRREDDDVSEATERLVGEWGSEAEDVYGEEARSVAIEVPSAKTPGIASLGTPGTAGAPKEGGVTEGAPFDVNLTQQLSTDPGLHRIDRPTARGFRGAPISGTSIFSPACSHLGASEQETARSKPTPVVPEKPSVKRHPVISADTSKYFEYVVEPELPSSPNTREETGNLGNGVAEECSIYGRQALTTPSKGDGGNQKTPLASRGKPQAIAECEKHASDIIPRMSMEAIPASVDPASVEGESYAGATMVEINAAEGPNKRPVQSEEEPLSRPGAFSLSSKGREPNCATAAPAGSAAAGPRKKNPKQAEAVESRRETMELLLRQGLSPVKAMEAVLRLHPSGKASRDAHTTTQSAAPHDDDAALGEHHKSRPKTKVLWHCNELPSHSPPHPYSYSQRSQYRPSSVSPSSGLRRSQKKSEILSSSPRFVKAHGLHHAASARVLPSRNFIPEEYKEKLGESRCRRQSQDRDRRYAGDAGERRLGKELKGYTEKEPSRPDRPLRSPQRYSARKHADRSDRWLARSSSHSHMFHSVLRSEDLLLPLELPASLLQRWGSNESDDEAERFQRTKRDRERASRGQHDSFQHRESRASFTPELEEELPSSSVFLALTSSAEDQALKPRARTAAPPTVNPRTPSRNAERGLRNSHTASAALLPDKRQPSIAAARASLPGNETPDGNYFSNHSTEAAFPGANDNGRRRQCHYCLRYFVEGRIGYHEEVCESRHRTNNASSKSRVTEKASASSSRTPVRFNTAASATGVREQQARIPSARSNVTPMRSSPLRMGDFFTHSRGPSHPKSNGTTTPQKPSVKSGGSVDIAKMSRSNTASGLVCPPPSGKSPARPSRLASSTKAGSSATPSRPYQPVF